MSMVEFDLTQFEEYRELQQQRDDLLEVCRLVVAWWEEHRYDTLITDDDKDNTYVGEPAMVVVAKRAIAEA